MRITEQEAKLAGFLTTKMEGWTDEDLDLIIKTDRMVIAYLQGKGPEWALALTPLYREIDTFQGFVDARKSNK